MLNIAYIGNGKSTNRYHIPFALKSGKFNINTIFSRHKNNQWAPINRVFYTEELSDVFENPEIDLVVVNTLTEFHYHYAKQALEHNKNDGL